MIDDRNNVPHSLANAMEMQEKLKEAIAPMMETQERLKAITSTFSPMLASLKTNVLFSSPVLDSLKNAVKTANFINTRFQIPPSVFETIKVLNEPIAPQLVESIRNVLNIQPAIKEMLSSPALDWFRSFDFTPITEALKGLHIDSDLSRRYRELNEIYLRTMYETKWFPYAGWIADMRLFREVNEIISTSRGASKTREKRIDKAILSYYTKTEIRRIKKAWWNTELDYCIKRTLSQAIEAYLRGEYALTISCLSTMWEGLIYIKANDVPSNERKRQRMDKTKEELKELVEYNDYELIFSDYFNDFIVSNCNEVKDVVDGVPNRHGVAHSWYRKYPNKKAALNAILLTDFIINLKPIEQTEENENG